MTGYGIIAKYEYETVTALLADTQDYTYFTAGDYVRVIDGGFSYLVTLTGSGDIENSAGTAVGFNVLGDGYSMPVAAFGPNADGATDDYAVIAAAEVAAKREKLHLVFENKTYVIATPLVLTDLSVNFNGAELLYTGSTLEWALTLNSNIDSKQPGRRFEGGVTVRSTSTDTTNRTHGVCIGGGLGYLSGLRVVGFTGVSFGMGSGAETHTGVTFSADQQCYYWELDVEVSPTAGWGMVINAVNNANHITSLTTFPFDGFGTAPTRVANCINELVVGGINNTFGRMSLEASPSAAKALFLASANANICEICYIEFNPSYATPPFPRIELEALSSSNIMRSVRHPYGGAEAISDLGTANDVRIVPSYYINGQQQGLPRMSGNLVKNGDFENKLNGWSNFSAGNTITYGTGYPSGKTLEMTLVAGRPNILQDIAAIGGYDISALIGQNITVSAWIKTDLSDFKIRQGNQSQVNAIGDGAWHFYQSTIKVPAGATAVSTQMITDASGLTGYVHVSNVTSVIGTDPHTATPAMPLDGSATYNPPSIADAAQQTTTVTVDGAVLGDFSTVSFNKDLQGMRLTSYVSATDTVTVVFRNNTGAAIDLASGTLRAIITKV